MLQTHQRRDIFDALDAIEQQCGIELRRAVASPERADQDRAKLFASLQRDPLIRRWAECQHAHNPNSVPQLGSPPNTEPWMALAEQRTWAAALAGELFPIRIFPHQDGKPETVQRMELAATLIFSQTYLWSNTVFETVHACPMPRHVVDRDLLPFPFTFHSTETAHSLVLRDLALPGGSPFDDPSADWISLAHSSDGFNVSMNASDYADCRNGGLILRSGVQYGRTFPDDFPEFARPATNLILSMLAFLKSPYVGVTHRPLPRQWRRHGGIAPADVNTTVAVVELRQAAREAVEAYNSESRSWKHRWWVSGHFRRQWQPSRQTHEVIWIAPYLKGPIDAPMLDKVYAVRR